METIRIGIIGTGRIAHRHMKVWNQLGGVEVVAACDIDESKLAAFGQQYGIVNLYPNFRDLLARDDIEAVEICTHPNLHLPMVAESMRAGKHCYCEKPIAASYADAKALCDTQKTYGKKLAIQMSSLYTYQTRLARRMVQEGQLGEVYHARVCGEGRLFRPGLDLDFQSPDFYSKFYSGHGALFDSGAYTISQMLYILGLPRLESVYGRAYQGVFIDEKKLAGRRFEVEDSGVGLATFEGGLTLDVLQAWAMNIDAVGHPIVVGSRGGLRLHGVDMWGGPLAVELGGPWPPPETPDLTFCTFDEAGSPIDVAMHCHDKTEEELKQDPAMAIYNDNQAHWHAYLSGRLTDETRYDTPAIAANFALLADGIFLSQKLGRSITRQEIEAMSVSTAIRRQEVPFGVLEYDF